LEKLGRELAKKRGGGKKNDDEEEDSIFQSHFQKQFGPPLPNLRRKRT